MRRFGKVRADQYEYFLRLIGKSSLIDRLEREAFSFDWREERRSVYVYYKGYWEAEIDLLDWAKVVDLNY